MIARNTNILETAEAGESSIHVMNQMQATDTLREWTESAPYWEKHSATIRTMFAPVTRALIKDAGIIKGQSVVAGGSGEPCLSIAKTVGRTGSSQR